MIDPRPSASSMGCAPGRRQIDDREAPVRENQARRAKLLP
jgi:hypothetical protein